MTKPRPSKFVPPKTFVIPPERPAPKLTVMPCPRERPSKLARLISAALAQQRATAFKAPVKRMRKDRVAKILAGKLPRIRVPKMGRRKQA